MIRTPTPHAAVVTLTGWPTVTDTGIRIQGVHVRTSWRPDQTPRRVTVRAFPETTPVGSVRRLYAPKGNVRAARGPNGTDVLIVGQLLKLDRAEGIIRVKVAPSQANTMPFSVTLQASREVLALDPGTFSVEVRGRVMSFGAGVLLADQVRPVFAPIPDRWHRVRATSYRRAAPQVLPLSAD